MITLAINSNTNYTDKALIEKHVTHFFTAKEDCVDINLPDMDEAIIVLQFWRS